MRRALVLCILLFCMIPVQLGRGSPNVRVSGQVRGEDNQPIADCWVGAFDGKWNRLGEELEYEKAQQSIERYRKKDVTLKIIDEAGNPLGGLTVGYAQVTHDFLFGVGLTSSEDPYYYDVTIFELLKDAGVNYALPYLTWELTARSPSWVETAYKPRTLHDMGYTLTGHCLVWFYDQFSNLPNYAKQLTFEELKQRVKSQILQVVDRYKAWIHIWEINEPNLEYTSSLHLTTQQWIEICKIAVAAIREADSDGKVLVNMLIGDIPQIRYFPIQFLRTLVKEGVQFDIIGLELYGNDRTPDAILDTNGYPVISWVSGRIDEFSQLGKPIFLSEVGVPSKPSEETQAEWLKQAYMLAFGKAAVQSVTWYNIYAPQSDPFYPGSGLFRAVKPSPEPKLAYYTLKDLISQWTTEGSEITDTNGYLRFQGYAGNYSITATTHEGLTQSFQLHVQEREGNSFILRFDRAGQIALVANLLSKVEKALSWAKGVGKEFDILKADRMLADAKSAFNSTDYERTKTIVNALLESVSMKMDGSDADWKGIRDVVTDVSGDAKAEGTDILDVFGVMDNEYLYLMMRVSGRINKEAAFIFDIDNDGKNDYAVRLHNDYSRLWLRKTDETISESLEYGWGDIIEVKVPLRLMQNPTTIKIKALSIISNKLSRDTGLSDQTDWGQVMVARMTTEVTGTLTKTTTVDWMQSNTLILWLFVATVMVIVLHLRRKGIPFKSQRREH